MKVQKRLSLQLTALVIAMAGSAQATLLVYDGFDYTTGTASGPTSNGVQLNGQSGAALGLTGAWSAWTANTSPITVYAGGTQSGVQLSTTGPVYLNYDGTVANLPTSGGYFGMGGTNNTDHMLASRPLAAGFAAANFTEGATTWFSFVSVRGYTANPAGFKLALGKGALIEDRGNLATGEAIGGGGGLGSAVRNGYKVYPQFWDSTTGSPGETTGTFSNFDVTGLNNNGVNYVSAPFAAEGSGTGWPPVNQIEGLQSMLLDYNDADGAGGLAPAQPNGARNIVIGKIVWHDGAPDVISTVVFEETETLTETTFDAYVTAQPLLSSASWAIQPYLDQSKFDTLSLAGGKWFVDEVRLATSFTEVTGGTLTSIPEPSSSFALLALLGLGAFVRNRRK
jgi:hypothetical protein